MTLRCCILHYFLIDHFINFLIGNRISGLALGICWALPTSYK